MKEVRGGENMRGLTVKVLDVSPKTTIEDLIYFFCSYCGTIDEIKLQWSENDQSMMAYVTFRNPFAFEAALLLDDAVIVDRKVRVQPSENFMIDIPIKSSETKKNNK
ncbi:hypothetical protein J5N97_016588 [Dioscorea zingiberensis]|uniref:RRM domain-containing protein n=1 Tax=Dioscorea zingiberensis TaxID=325984 RepID=A0A9D5CJQ5_9LILI|nr:hypothetical protein J5N97_016588 [Dioscorea zingiberensis]